MNKEIENEQEDTSSAEASTSNKEEQRAVNTSSGDDRNNGKLCAVLSYLIIGIIWYFVDEKMKQNDFVKFHVKQSLLLIIVNVVGGLILGIIPVIGWLLLPFFGIATLILWVIGVINSLNGAKKDLPLIGSYADRLLKF